MTGPSVLPLLVIALLVGAAAGLLTLPPGRPRRLRPGPSGPRRHPAARGPGREIDPAVVIDLLSVAIGSGASIPQALEVVGGAVGGREGDRLVTVARSLRLGSPWAKAWDGHPLRDTLEPAWRDGVCPTGLLGQAARTIRADRRTAARAAASRLGVRLVLPVGLCLLPAFVLLGLVPVLLGSGFDLLR